MSGVTCVRCGGAVPPPEYGFPPDPFCSYHCRTEHADTERPTEPPPDLEAKLDRLSAAVGEMTNFAIEHRNACERVVNGFAEILQLVRAHERERIHTDRRLTRLEKHAGLPPLHPHE